MEDKKDLWIIVFYLMVAGVFPLYMLYLFMVRESASFSFISIIFAGFLVILNLVLIVFLFSSRVRDVFGLE